MMDIKTAKYYKAPIDNPKNENTSIIVTTDNDDPVTITNKVTIAMLKALSNQQRKRPDTYLDDLIKHQYLYL